MGCKPRKVRSSGPPVASGKGPVETTDLEDGLSSEARSKNSENSSSLGVMIDWIWTRRQRITTIVLPGIVLTLGFVIAGTLLATGISLAHTQEEERFQQAADDAFAEVEIHLDRFQLMAQFSQQALRNGEASRDDFRQLYLNLNATDLDMEQIVYLPRVTSEERLDYEQEARDYLAAHFPQHHYLGFAAAPTRVQTTSDLAQESNLLPYEENSTYYPAQYTEPVETLFFVTGLDASRAQRTKNAFARMLETGTPTITEPIQFYPSHRSVYLFHPGLEFQETNYRKGDHVVGLRLGIPALLKQLSHGGNSKLFSIHLFDITEEPSFLGGVDLDTCRDENDGDCVFFQDELLSELRKVHKKRQLEKRVRVAERDWLVVIDADENSFQPKTVHIIISSVVICLACIVLAFAIRRIQLRTSSIDTLKRQNQADKDRMKLEVAHNAMRAERELNDWCAHEVRNPLSAAISATSFVATVVETDNPSQVQLGQARADVKIIQTTLSFMDDLLRNMLDISRLSSRQVKITPKDLDLRDDILQPSVTMLHARNPDVEILLDCPRDLIISSDTIRLKQIVLNLATNSITFVQKGYVRLRAEVTATKGEPESVLIFVEDSGPGIPKDRREQLFSKYQESLDLLSQGTGMGLFIVKELCRLLAADISLDDQFESGIEGFPGTRFALDLKISPKFKSLEKVPENATSSISFRALGDSSNKDGSSPTLPEHLSILFVDDDAMLRKLFRRSVTKHFPTWDIKEAACGETAIAMAEVEHFDVMYVDQYMPSLNKQLLGSEAVQMMRSKGVKSRICGLSANDMEHAFLESGANAFRLKPFPCSKGELTKEISRVLYGPSKS